MSRYQVGRMLEPKPDDPTWGNPLSEWLKESPPAFALGVPVRDVVLATLKAYAKRARKKRKVNA